jgi:uncharacterized damage-inducible protein DinB
MKQQLLDYANYNLWANTRMVDLFRQQPSELLHQELVSSFPSISLTFLHLWTVEDIWFRRLQGESPKVFLSEGFSGTDTDIFDGLLAISTAIRDFVAAQDAVYLSTPLTFGLLTATGQFTHPPFEMLQHLFNHQTGHRGQLITMGRQLGVQSFPRMDYIIWARENAASQNK